MGALRVLNENGCLRECKRFAGSSAGCLPACMCALSFDFDFIEQVITCVDFAALCKDATNSRLHAVIKGYLGLKESFGTKMNPKTTHSGELSRRM